MTDRTDLWLPLLRRLTEALPSWLVYKNAESAFKGTGDIDAAAPERDWPAIEREFRTWAADMDLGTVIVCRHPTGTNLLIAVPDDASTFLELGVNARRIWRGSTLFVAEDLLSMAVMDPRGFRRLRPGAEGVLKLVLNGIRRGGRANAEALASKDVPALLRSDPDGVAWAARLFGPARPAVVAGARRAASGGWSRPAMLLVEWWALVKALRHPKLAIERLRFRRGARRSCPVIEAVNHHDRRIPGDRAAWLERSLAAHPMTGGSGSVQRSDLG